MTSFKVTAEELERRVDLRLRLRGQRLYLTPNGDRHVIERLRREVVQRNVNYDALVVELGVLKPGEELVIS